MKIAWKISRSDVARIRAFMREQKSDGLVQQRRNINLANDKPQVRRARFWQQMVSMRLTSVQRSGPSSHVGRLIRAKPFPLSYEVVRCARHPEGFIADQIKRAGGIRFRRTIARQLATNFAFLEEGGWAVTLRQCNRLLIPASSAVEKEVANYIEERFIGFGPKQSRNLLQALGLTRYEVPLDSRVTKWLNEFGFPVRLNAAALADRDYYEFVSDGLQSLCKKAGQFPCIVDAAIFAQADDDAWGGVYRT